VGTDLSIRFTVAVAELVFQALSTNSKTKLPFSVKTYWFDQLLFVILQLSFRDIVAITFQFVAVSVV
jgi:hypothetical protein